MDEHKVQIPMPFGNLEAQMIMGDNTHTLGIIVCHPHPQFGGTMANNVVRVIYKSFSQAGFPALRFNFRGVENSDGFQTGGEGEREDALAACHYLLDNTQPTQQILIIGYSFGAMIGASIVDELDALVGYVAVSYPFTMLPQYIAQAQSYKPKLFLMGEWDDYTSMDAFSTSL